jgi:hypothetical protein
MSDSFEAGVLDTEHAGLPATMPGLTSPWSYETRTGGRDRASIMRNPDGGYLAPGSKPIHVKNRGKRNCPPFARKWVFGADSEAIPGPAKFSCKNYTMTP